MKRLGNGAPVLGTVTWGSRIHVLESRVTVLGAFATTSASSGYTVAGLELQCEVINQDIRHDRRALQGPLGLPAVDMKIRQVQEISKERPKMALARNVPYRFGQGQRAQQKPGIAVVDRFVQKARPASTPGGISRPQRDIGDVISLALLS